MLTEIAPRVFWTGVVDWERRLFHGHELSTHRGTSYNSYIVKDEKIAIIDSVWEVFAEEFIDKVREVVDPADVDYVIANHAEPDHASGLKALMPLCPKAELIVSKRGMDSFPGHYHADWKMRAVKTGDRLSLGGRELVFVEAPMLHWPDSMFTYLTGAGILFSNDAFGQHYAAAFRFNDEVDRAELYGEALKYYANILTPFSAQVGKKIDELLALGIPVAMVAPSHGVIWRDDPMQIVNQYREWAAQKCEPRAVVLYDTMWHATRRMAEAVAEGLGTAGVDHKVFHMGVSDRNDVLTEVFRSKAVVIGSPTLNNGLLPTITPILEDLKGLKFKNKLGAAFGSFGWSGESVRLIEEHFERCKIPLVCDGVKAKWQPDGDALKACRDLGRKVAEAVKKDAGNGAI